MNASDLKIRGLRSADRATLKSFRCSSGEPWEEAVEHQLHGPLPGRYLDTPPYFDGRMLLGFNTEVIAVALEARGLLVKLPEGEQVSLGQFMLLTIFRQMVRLGRHPRTFVRVDRRNARSLALLDRVGLAAERPDSQPELVQRWGELPRAD